VIVYINYQRVLWPLALALQVAACTGDRQVLFDIRAELRKGMDRAAVNAVIEKHRAASVHIQTNQGASEEVLRLTSDDSCILYISLRDGRLNEASLRDEDAINSPCGGAPADLK
jgi:hypothetical protein